MLSLLPKRRRSSGNHLRSLQILGPNVAKALLVTFNKQGRVAWSLETYSDRLRPSAARQLAGSKFQSSGMPHTPSAAPKFTTDRERGTLRPDVQSLMQNNWTNGNMQNIQTRKDYFFHLSFNILFIPERLRRVLPHGSVDNWAALALKKTRQKAARAHNHIIYDPDIHYDLRSFRAIRRVESLLKPTMCSVSCLS